MKLLRRLKEEMVYFPVFIAALLLTPVMIISIASANRELKNNHRKVIAILTRDRAFRKLLRHALALDVKFSIHHKKLKRQDVSWEIICSPPAPYTKQALAGRYLNFLFSFGTALAHPVIRVQIDHRGRLKPSSRIDRLWFLSHELGHLARHQKGQGRCSWGKRRHCFRDELSATLEGIKILKDLGYTLNFSALAQRAFYEESITGRCFSCINDARCRNVLSELLSFTRQKESRGWSINSSKLRNKARKL